MGGKSRCSRKPGKRLMLLLVSPCHLAKSSLYSGRTRVCVTMLTLREGPGAAFVTTSP